MDDELRTFLGAMEGRLTGRIDVLAGHVDVLTGRVDALAGNVDVLTGRVDVLTGRVAKTVTILAALDERIEARIDKKLDESFTRWSQFMLDEMSSRFGKMNNRYESLDARIKLHAGLLQSGARSMARYSSFSENSEERWIAMDQRVAEIERKLNTK